MLIFRWLVLFLLLGRRCRLRFIWAQAAFISNAGRC